MNVLDSMRMLVVVAACTVLAQVASAGAASSPITSVVLRPDLSLAWATAKGNVLQLPVEYPKGATSAKLEVTGSFGYSATYPDIVDSFFELTLPVVTAEDGEQVYDLKLTFDDAAETVRSARIGCVFGYDGTSVGRAACRVNVGDRKWGRVESKNVILPIPAGTETFTVNGVERETGLDGAAGWYGLVVDGTQASPQVVRVAGEDWSATADLRVKEGVAVILR